MATNQPDRERALLIAAGGDKLLQPEPQDVVALLDFLEDPDLAIVDDDGLERP